MQRVGILYFNKMIASLTLAAFFLTSFTPFSFAQNTLPQLTLQSSEAMLQGIRVSPDNPFQFDFLIDQGKGARVTGQGGTSHLTLETSKLIKYFLAALTTPPKDMWVNLNPKEPDRIVAKEFGTTDMGRDLLAQDYILKQLTASLLSPDGEVGRKFWDKIYERVQSSELSGQRNSKNLNSDLCTLTSKIWIIPDTAEVYTKDGVAFVTKARLKVRLEEDHQRST